MSSIQAAKAGIGYVQASQRDRCGNCTHVRMPGQEPHHRPSPSESWWCACPGLGFLTTPYSVCSKFDRKAVRS